jgi:hypothetical protein
MAGRPGELRLLSLGGLGRLVLRQGLRLRLVDDVGLGLLCKQGLRLLLLSRCGRQWHGRAGGRPHLDGPGPRLLEGGPGGAACAGRRGALAAGLSAIGGGGCVPGRARLAAAIVLAAVVLAGT